MKYLLDSDTLIDYIVDRGNARPQITAMIEQGDEVAVCPITVAEVYSGLSDKRRGIWEDRLKALSYWDIGYNVAAQAGRYRKTASEAGRTFAVTDSLLAALARDKEAILLTSNIRDFPMEGLKVLSLRKAAADV